jgi:hypothetical protein
LPIVLLSSGRTERRWGAGAIVIASSPAADMILAKAQWFEAAAYFAPATGGNLK